MYLVHSTVKSDGDMARKPVSDRQGFLPFSLQRKCLRSVHATFDPITQGSPGMGMEGMRSFQSGTADAVGNSLEGCGNAEAILHISMRAF